MQQDLAEILLAAASEAEAMNYLTNLPLDRDDSDLGLPPRARQ